MKASLHPFLVVEHAEQILVNDRQSTPCSELGGLPQCSPLARPWLLPCLRWRGLFPAGTQANPLPICHHFQLGERSHQAPAFLASFAGLPSEAVGHEHATTEAPHVPFDFVQLVHSRHSTPDAVTLDDYRDRIVKEIDGVALRVGRWLREAKALDPDLPFGTETAKRLMAISAAYEKLPPDQLRQLPRPWQAMYALKALPPPLIASGIANGDITPDMTVDSARRYARKLRGGGGPAYTRRADIVAGMLMQFSAKELAPGVREMLNEWLQRAAAPH